MWRNVETAAMAGALIAITSIAAAQPATIPFDSHNSGGADTGAGATVFHGAPSATGNAAVASDGTTVFHGTHAATGSAAAGAPPPPSSAGR